ncbi:S49 family peptidase [Azospirillum cavernae]|uniref:S49 family peptidase n=1 Tax=Azospirillum cavernae TaxID=2320860 RepID=A0A418VVF3_9PROT|nr:S49 family peptidase [Azospirillum cavernae]RJF81121.1 S49 family peptidase [Azospirillum cavernae]
MFSMLHGPALLAPEWEAAAADALIRFRSERSNPPRGALALVGDVGGGQRLYGVADGVAVIPVSGLLVQKLCWIGWGYITGYDGLRVQLARAFADPEVKAIALDIDSGGGDVAGCFDLVEWIVAAKAAAGKPVAAILSEMAYSAAYAIATSADSVAVPRTGGLGSIGALCVHWDFSALLSREGVAPTLIHSGQHKVDGNPFQPLPEDVRARWTATVDDLRRLFADVVARNRQSSGAALTMEQAMGTEARCFTGPAGVAEAVRLGLADAILSPDRAFAALVSHASTL